MPAREPDAAIERKPHAIALAALALACACGGAETALSAPAATPPAPTSPPTVPSGDVDLAYAGQGGMWVPRQLGAHHAETLARLGLKLDPKSLSDPMSAPLAAVVSLGGCSASFVSPEGLVVTNHHCVTGALQFNSTPKENLQETGFLAKSRASERSIGPTGRVYVTTAFTDVTLRMREGLDAIAGDLDRQKEHEKREKAVIAECEKKPSVRCELASYYGGAEYLLVERLEIKDVRLVYAPARGIGNFGGEVDNWMWPRHTGDFGFYRAYVGKDGAPAELAEGNVPYRPPHHLRISKTPLRAGNLVMVAGYPGRTYRNRTAAEVGEAVEWWYPRRLAFCDQFLAALDEVGKTDEDARIRATPLHRGLSNVRKYTLGALEGLEGGGAAQTKSDAERQLVEWIESDPARKARFGEALVAMEKAFAERARFREADASLTELDRFVSLLGAANTIVRLAEERAKPDEDRNPAYQKRNWEMLEQGQKRLEKSYSRKVDRALLVLALERAVKLPEAERPTALETITGERAPSSEAIAKAADALLAKTKLEKTVTRVALSKAATSKELARSTDPLIRVAVKLRAELQEKEDREHAFDGAMIRWRPLYETALREQSGGRIAPDANSTLRVTYGTVRGYRPRPHAPLYTEFTRLSEVVKKATGKEPFDAPELLLAAARAGKVGPYVDSVLGEVPVNFLSDLDITGGNSGSATIDARGELVGLAFDGNYEAMASDWLFMPALTRAIHVDIRYALWIMDAVDGADELLEELGQTPSIE